MRKIILLVVVLWFICAAPSWAGPLHHVRHYLNTRKELILSDALNTLALSADAASSVHAQRICPACVEEAWLVGKHPSPGVTWSWAVGEDVLLVGASHLAWHYAPEPMYRHIIWIWTAPLVTEEAWNVKGNADIRPEPRLGRRGPEPVLPRLGNLPTQIYGDHLMVLGREVGR